MTHSVTPSILQMLTTGEACGLGYLDEAYSNYMLHYDMFFYIPEFAEQHNAFIKELLECELAYMTGEKTFGLANISINDAIEQYKNFKLENLG